MNEWPVDDVLDALSHRYRRRVLLSLLEDDPQSVASVVAVMAVDGVDEKATRVELQHRHLPKLAERGYIEWNDEGGQITRGENWDTAEYLLRLLADSPGERFSDLQ